MMFGSGVVIEYVSKFCAFIQTSQSRQFQAFLFRNLTPKMIITPDDAAVMLVIGEDDEDPLNEVRRIWSNLGSTF